MSSHWVTMNVRGVSVKIDEIVRVSIRQYQNDGEKVIPPVYVDVGLRNGESVTLYSVDKIETAYRRKDQLMKLIGADEVCLNPTNID